MIDIKELRIGAHVEFNKERVKILGIDVADDEDVPVIIKTSLASVEPDEIEPIILTNELLEEIGFEPYNNRSSDGGVLDTGDYFIWVMDCEGHYWHCQITERFGLKDDIVDCCGFSTLHQLENIVYNATEVELIKGD